jgi:DNA repair exonuclease SbcCD ATPase subunit
MNSLQSIRNILEQRKGTRDHISKSLVSLENTLQSEQSSLVSHEQAREVMREVAMITQSQLQYHISDITSLALNAVFPDPYELKVDFVKRRNKTECDIVFVRNEKEIDPMEASGVGAIDIASFVLRIASWSMSIPHSRNVIILDEPFRFLSKDYQEQASIMLKEVSQKLGIQMIIVTHEEILSNYADKTFEVSMRNIGGYKRSLVKVS